MNFDFKDWRAKQSFSAAVRRRVWKKVAVQIKHGIPFYRAIQMLLDRARRNKRPEARIFEHILRNNNAGGTLASALVGYASPEEIMLIGAGEKKDLSMGLNLACDMMSNKNTIRRLVIGASAYPLFLVIMCIFIMLIVSFLLVPEFSKMVPPENWTGPAGALRDFAGFVSSVYGATTGIILVVLAAAIFFTFPVWTGKFRVVADRFAPWSIYREVTGATWLFSVATLMSAGIQPRSIFSENMMSKTCTPYLKERVEAIDYHMALGKNFGVAMQDAMMDFPSTEIVDDMCAYAELPDLERQISSIALDQMNSCVESVRQKMKMLQTALMFIVVGIVIFVIISIYSLQNSLGQGSTMPL